MTDTSTPTLELLAFYGWELGHAPEGVRAERMKYRDEDGAWVNLHKLENPEIVLSDTKYWGVWSPLTRNFFFVNFETRELAFKYMRQRPHLEQTKFLRDYEVRCHGELVKNTTRVDF